jgi:hypothetical protein
MSCTSFFTESNLRSLSGAQPPGRTIANRVHSHPIPRFFVSGMEVQSVLAADGFQSPSAADKNPGVLLLQTHHAGRNIRDPQHAFRNQYCDCFTLSISSFLLYSPMIFTKTRFLLRRPSNSP